MAGARGSSNVTLTGVNPREISTVVHVYATLKVGVGVARCRSCGEPGWSGAPDEC